MNRLIRLVGLTACLFTGCVYGPLPRYRVLTSEPPLTSEEIVKMSKGGVSDTIIIEKIKANGVATRPTAQQIMSLKKEGLSDLLIQSMVSARVPESTETVLEETHHAYPHDTYFYPYDNPGWYNDAHWYAWPYYGWSWFWGYPYRYHYWSYPGRGSTVRRYRP